MLLGYVSDVGLKRGMLRQCQKSERIHDLHRLPVQFVVFGCARRPDSLNFTSTDRLK